MATIPEMLTAAVQRHQARQWQEAENAYRAILQLDPQQSDALHLLGLICCETGRAEMALAYVTAALRLNPTFAEAHFNLGSIYQRLGRLDEAIASYRQALRCKPEYAEAHFNLGHSFLEQKSLVAAEASFRDAIRFQPNYFKAYNNLGSVLQDQDRLDEAVAAFQQALRLKPDYATGFSNLGNALQLQGQMDEALAHCAQAVRLEPANIEAQNNLGTVYFNQGKTAEAFACFQEALRLKPDFADARLNRAQVYLSRGDFAQGWPEYEWRWKSRAFQDRHFRQPLWDGAALTGRTILLHAEQGLGDTLHFIRYAEMVKSRGGRVIVECPKALAPLLARCRGVDQWVAVGSALPDFDVQAPFLSLPALFGTTLTNVPAAVPYVFAEPALVVYWRNELGALPGFKVGIAWQGNPRHKQDRNRSMSLAQFAPLAQVPGVQLISLQKGHGAEQLRMLTDRFTVIDLGQRLDEANGPFMDTAAVMKNVDLVITSDTATAHLAGALGVPVWVALAFVADWRWMQQRDDSPWYPTMRLFRQSRRGEWAEVFERLAAELTRQARR